MATLFWKRHSPSLVLTHVLMLVDKHDDPPPQDDACSDNGQMFSVRRPRLMAEIRYLVLPDAGSCGISDMDKCPTPYYRTSVREESCIRSDDLQLGELGLPNTEVIMKPHMLHSFMDCWSVATRTRGDHKVKWYRLSDHSSVGSLCMCGRSTTCKHYHHILLFV
jgi:hypothetical protein